MSKAQVRRARRDATHVPGAGPAGKGQSPVYQFRGDVYMPVDPGWRSVPTIRPLIVMGATPESFFNHTLKSVISALTMTMSDADSNTIGFGMLLNLIQSYPIELRQALTNSIVEGLVMHMVIAEDGAIEASLDHEVDAFDTATGAIKTASGLVLPPNVTMR